jgi:23S rRNA (guanine745-N1)-methyltransferase
MVSPPTSSPTFPASFAHPVVERGHSVTTLERTLGYLRCPVCGRVFSASGGSLACESGHSYDIARQGYVSFLTGHASPTTADSSEMVAARARFLERGLYDPIADAIVTVIDSQASGLALELGGGTGFYLTRLLDARPALVGIDLDLSVSALRIAGRAHPRLAAIAADAWSALPVADAAAGVVLSVFSPRNAAEMARIIRPDGRLVIVSPTPRHLHELVATLGLVTVDERKPERLERQFTAFEQLSLRTIEYPLRLDSDAVRDVVLMGPSARHLDRARLDGVPAATDVTVSVELRLYRPLQMTEANGRIDG